MHLPLIRPWFAHPWALTLLALLPLLAVLGLLSLRWRRRTLARLGSVPALRALASRQRGLRVVRVLCLTFGLLFLIAGMAGPQWGRDWEQSTAPGRDLVLVLDVSRSMLAQDVLPNRVERAKKALQDLSYTVQLRGGYRLALVAFAARARIFCPLTHDYNHFRLALDELDAVNLHPDLRPLGPDAVSGTRIGAGLRMAVEAHDPRFQGYQDILLISDGDDPAKDEEWREGAEAAHDRHIPVHTVGVGNPRVRSPIPVRGDEPLKHNNQVVLTRLEERPLQDIARWTGGTYTPAGVHTLPLGEIFRERIEPRGTHETGEDTLPVYRQHYAWFFGVAFSFLGMEMILGQRRPGKGAKERKVDP
jgi:Ca-activated chloride channel family protein